MTTIRPLASETSSKNYYYYQATIKHYLVSKVQVHFYVYGTMIVTNLFFYKPYHVFL